MPLIEALEYKEVRKIEELAIVIDTSESCSGEYVRRFLEETFAILTNKDNFFRKMNFSTVFFNSCRNAISPLLFYKYMI